MIVVFGKAKVGNGVAHLLSLLSMPFVVMDDRDYDDAQLCDAEYILVSPGIKQSHILYQKYSSKIVSELQFLSGLLPRIGLKKAEWIGITATNGKSTTTWVTYQVFTGLFPDKKVWITGNFDIPVSEILAQIIEQGLQNQEHIFVVECSSFMLYGLRNFWFDYSILLNIARDHLDWHKDFDEYQESKLTLLRRTHRAIFVPESVCSSLDDALISRVVSVQEHFDLSATKFVGKHNEINLSCIRGLILKYCSSLGWTPSQTNILFKNVLSGVEPLPHRLSLLREVGGIRIYDDGICTSSHSLSAALSSFSEKLVLIAGGYDKGDDYDWLSKLFISTVGYAIVMGQIGPKLEAVCERGQIPYVIVPSLQEGVTMAFAIAKQKSFSTILYSPGAASFDMFKNVYERVEQFEYLVKQL